MKIVSSPIIPASMSNVGSEDKFYAQLHNVVSNLKVFLVWSIVFLSLFLVFTNTYSNLCYTRLEPFLRKAYISDSRSALRAAGEVIERASFLVPGLFCYN